MFKPKYYKNITKHTSNIAKETLDKYVNLLRWKNNGTDTFVDVGCGVGDFAKYALLPIMPSAFDKVVGYDISENMVKYATETYGYEKLRFEVLDITRDLDLDKISKFDHATSFFTLQWVNNRRTAVSNIFKLLNEEGDFIFSYPAWAIIFDFIDEMIKSDKWCPHISHYKPIWMRNYKSNDYLKEFEYYLTESGFIKNDLTTKWITENFNTYEHFKDFFYGINPVHDSLTKDQQEEFYQDFLKFNLKFNKQHPAVGITDPSFCFQVEMLSGYASKQK